MKTKWAWLSACIAMGNLAAFAQDRSVSIQEAIQLATTQSKEAKAADTRISGKKLELGVARNKQLPDAKISGQFAMLSTPNIDLKIPMGEGKGAPDIKANQLLLGQASVSMPLYAGGKIKNSIHIAESAVEMEQFAALNTKEQLATQAIRLYVALYKAQQTATLMEENIKRSEQQVTDFKAMEANGLIARNDLLKTELQLSNYRVALQEAVKNVKVVNYQLVTLLQLDESTVISLLPFKDENALLADTSVETALMQRNELKILETQHKIAKDQLKISKADYLPSIALTGGYMGVGIKNVLTVTNALNIGVGLSYDLGSLYKNSKNVSLAKHQISEVEEQIEIMNDRVKIQVQQATENYQLAQDQEKVYEQAVKQAGENYRIVKDKYDNGVADTDDLLEADVQQLQTRINEAVSKANVMEKYYDLLLANGQLTSK